MKTGSSLPSCGPLSTVWFLVVRPGNHWCWERLWQGTRHFPVPSGLGSISSPGLCLLLLLAAGGPELASSLKGWGFVVKTGSLPTAHQGFEQGDLQKPSLYFSFQLFNQFAQAEDEWVLEGKVEHLGTDPPRNSLCTLLRPVRLEKRFNNELYRIRNVEMSRQLLAGFFPPHGG